MVGGLGTFVITLLTVDPPPHSLTKWEEGGL